MVNLSLHYKTNMGDIDKLFLKILSGTSYANISFDDLCNILKNIDFDFHTKGSHHVFGKVGAEEEINLQKDWAKAKCSGLIKTDTQIG